MKGIRPGATRRFRPFPVHRHRFVSCGFPRLFRLLLQPGVRFPDRLSGPSLQRPFDQVQVSENHVRPELAFRRRLRGSVRSVRLSILPPPCPVPPGSGSGSVRAAGPPPSGIPGLPPGPRLLFRSFAVRFAHGPYLSSFCVRFSFSSCSFRLFCPCLILFCSFLFVFVRSRLCLAFLFLSSLSCVAPAHRRFIYIFSRILYTTKGDFQMYFLSENMFFLRIVQIIDINPKNFADLEL